MGLMFFLGGSLWPVSTPIPEEKPEYQLPTMDTGNDAQLVMDQAYPVSPELLMQEALQPTASAYYMQVLHQLPTASVTKLNLVDPGIRSSVRDRLYKAKGILVDAHNHLRHRINKHYDPGSCYLPGGTTNRYLFS